jgi:hypothetical protein
VHADIVEGPDLAVAALDGEEALVADLEGEKVAGAAKLRGSVYSRRIK